jgi:hypothetical protein
MLGQPEHNPSLAHARADMPVGICARARPGPGFLLDLITVAIVFPSLASGEAQTALALHGAAFG